MVVAKISVTIPKELYEEMRRIKKDKGIPISVQVSKAVQKWLKEMKY